ncbi:hypothetical protein NDU88_005884 [Pleurodeles waltl]|uniref:Uncharacterized protein n=1 Tax=Pleurodeles waltl TaxID=8319 RepID=A0AAV7NNS4_PLEWA|nr:hypothetical protein NDU88_005884 [Pleurodeles waltl]
MAGIRGDPERKIAKERLEGWLGLSGGATRDNMALEKQRRRDAALPRGDVRLNKMAHEEYRRKLVEKMAQVEKVVEDMQPTQRDLKKQMGELDNRVLRLEQRAEDAEGRNRRNNKAQTEEGIQYSLMFPAKLKTILNGKTQDEDPLEAWYWFDSYKATGTTAATRERSNSDPQISRKRQRRT